MGAGHQKDQAVLESFNQMLELDAYLPMPHFPERGEGLQIEYNQSCIHTKASIKIPTVLGLESF